MLAMLIALDSDPAYVDPRRRKVLMPQRILSLDDAAGLFGDYPRERMTGLVNMNFLYPCGARVALQVFREGV